MQANRQISWNDTIRLGQIQLKNRVCMAALTRQRYNPSDGIPNHLLIEYYTQRTGAGMILTQATAWNQRAQCFPGAACLYNQHHVEGWKKVVDSVHSKNCKIFLQIFHGGRACLKQTTRGLQPFAPSQIAVRDNHRRLNIPHDIPKEMTLQDIQQTKKDFRNSIKLAKQCNFDGIQLHAAHGYLVDQFIRSQSNKRTDQYGGSVENRCRFALQLVEIILEYYKPSQVGLKISPVSRINDMYDMNPVQTYSYLCQRLSQRQIGFLQIRESNQVNLSKQQYPKTSKQQIPDICQALRPYFKGIIIANQQFNSQTGIAKMKTGNADMVSFGRLYISNPDLAERLIEGKQLNSNWDMKTFFGTQHGQKGYSDYPIFQQWNKN